MFIKLFNRHVDDALHSEENFNSEMIFLNYFMAKIMLRFFPFFIKSLWNKQGFVMTKIIARNIKAFPFKFISEYNEIYYEFISNGSSIAKTIQ